MAITVGKVGRVGKGERVAIVAGLRTPFVRAAAGDYDGLSAADLGALVVRELVARAELRPQDVECVVYGESIPTPGAPNIAREIVFRSGLPRDAAAFSVASGSATSLQATTSAAEAMLAGQHDVAVAGGAEGAKAKTLGDKMRVLSKFSARVLGETSAVAKGAAGAAGKARPTMGEHAERMAKADGIAREDQDRFAHRSHRRAAAAWDGGVFDAEVMHVVAPPSFDRPVTHDDVVRHDSRLEAYASFRPAFDPKHGTVTAGNSSPSAEGASALLLMTEAKARALGYEPLGYLRSWAYAAVDPEDGLLMGPAHAAPLALGRARLRLADMDLVEMHEAFAAQVLGNKKALGEIDDERFNVHGGSIAIGHPPAATGARMVHTVLRELRRRGGKFGLATTSAEGGLGAAVVLEVA